MSNNDPIVTQADYFNILGVIASSFLKTQPNNTHTFIFRNILYVIRDEVDQQAMRIPGLDENLFPAFLEEFALFAFKATLKSLDISTLVITTGEFDFEVSLVRGKGISVRKSNREEEQDDI